MPATLAILNANIITLNPKKPRVQALAAKNGRIIAIGTNTQIRKLICGSTTVVDAENKTVVPGLVDCHVHMTEFGFFLQSPDLKNAPSIREMQLSLKEYASRSPGESWILGGRWDHEKFAEKRLPTRWDIDAVLPSRPVFLVRVCGHIGVANSEALRLAGITRETAVEGGKICLDEASGQPNGVLEENAMSLVLKAVPKRTRENLEEASLLACETAVQAGLTTVHWITDSVDEINAIRKLDSEGRLPLRVYLGVALKCLDTFVDERFSSKAAHRRVKVGFVKLFADGSLGSRTAALKEPYSDNRNSRGTLLSSPKRLYQLIAEAHRSKHQVAVHAIGDRAVESVLDAYEKALKQHPRKDHRHRIEHCSILNPRLINRMKHLDLTASIQPHFVVSDFWLVDRVGAERARWAFPFKTLVKRGLTVISGSDCPVENISPLLGIWAAVAKRGSSENLTAEQALRTYTSTAAYASFDESEKGTVEIGKLADFTILSHDILRVRPDFMRKIKVDMTIIDGKVAYARQNPRQR